jgi:hypothetical protein
MLKSIHKLNDNIGELKENNKSLNIQVKKKKK